MIVLTEKSLFQAYKIPKKDLFWLLFWRPKYSPYESADIADIEEWMNLIGPEYMKWKRKELFGEQS